MIVSWLGLHNNPMRVAWTGGILPALQHWATDRELQLQQAAIGIVIEAARLFVRPRPIEPDDVFTGVVDYDPYGEFAVVVTWNERACATVMTAEELETEKDFQGWTPVEVCDA